MFLPDRTKAKEKKRESKETPLFVTVGWRRGVESGEREGGKSVSRKRGDYRLMKSARPDRLLPCSAESDANKRRLHHLSADNPADVEPAFSFYLFI